MADGPAQTVDLSEPEGGLSGHLGLKTIAVGEGWIEMALTIAEHHLRPGIAALHAGTMLTLADTACGFGCRRTLPDGATGFSTLEVKSNFLGTAKEGTLVARAKGEHLGRSTQVWSAEVRHMETDRRLAIFQCTQLILWPRL